MLLIIKTLEHQVRFIKIKRIRRSKYESCIRDDLSWQTPTTIWPFITVQTNDISAASFFRELYWELWGLVNLLIDISKSTSLYDNLILFAFICLAELILPSKYSCDLRKEIQFCVRLTRTCLHLLIVWAHRSAQTYYTDNALKSNVSFILLHSR